MQIEKALEKANKDNLDLVQVSLKTLIQLYASYWIMGNMSLIRKIFQTQNQRLEKTSLKEIKFRPSTDTGDYNIKLKKIKSFILSGNKTKINVRFRGREILNSDLGLELLNKIRDELAEISQVDQEPSLEGRQLQMVLSPVKK